MKLTSQEEQIVIGGVLGDGYLQKTGKQNARFRLEHSEVQKDYLFWKTKQLKRLFQGKPKFIKRKHPLTKKVYSYWRHQSQTMPELGKIRMIFYPEGKKIIPQNLVKILGRLGLAVWYMDDGYYYRRDKSAFLYLGRVSAQEAEIARDAIREKFQLESIIKDKKQKGYVLYFSPSQTRKLKKVINSFIIEKFRYKLPS